MLIKNVLSTEVDVHVRNIFLSSLYVRRRYTINIPSATNIVI